MVQEPSSKDEEQTEITFYLNMDRIVRGVYVVEV
jgi:hypothetical protein